VIVATYALPLFRSRSIDLLPPSRKIGSSAFRVVRFGRAVYGRGRLGPVGEGDASRQGTSVA
jgi:hypothetical protein